MWEKIKWSLKQLLPLAYTSTYTENGQRKLCLWRQWFGFAFAIQYFDLRGGDKDE